MEGSGGREKKREMIGKGFEEYDYLFSSEKGAEGWKYVNEGV